MINKNDVLKIARLANLELSESEVEKYTGDLTRIVALADKLTAIDVSTATSSKDSVEKNVFRPTGDEIIHSNVATKILEQAPGHEGPFFTVPKVVDKS